MLKFISKLFPSKHEKDVKEIRPVVDKINEYYEEYNKLTDEQLIEKTQEFKGRIKNEAGEIENKIIELQEKLKEDLTHDEIVEINTEIDNLEDEYYEVVKSVLDSLLPEAFAVVKDTCRRLCGKEWDAAGFKIKWNMIPFDVQLIGGVVLHTGKISEMATGEGKTLVAALTFIFECISR